MDQKKINLMLGGYQITDYLSNGASGEVYIARHRFLANRLAAIKFLQPLFGKEQQEQFVKEAYVLAQLKHPNILPIYEMGFHEGQAYMVTEYASGGSLKSLLQTFGPIPMPIERALQILREVSLALAYAHQQNIIHRDVKPGNILFDGSETVLLSDFGIAIILDPGQREAHFDVSGTPRYMAPEILRGEVSAASDQYALGCIAYELLTGRAPFTGDTPLEVLRKQEQEYPIPPHTLVPSLTPAIEQVVLRALAKQKAQRFASTSAFTQALEEAVHESTAKTSRLVPQKTLAIPGNLPVASTVLFQTSMSSDKERKDFFITYHNTDRFWAEWIAWHLEEAGYTTIVPAWDFHIGTNIEIEMQKAVVKARSIIAVLSPDYFSLRKNIEDWSTTFRAREAGRDERILPVLVRACESRHQRFLRSLMYIDLVESDEAMALRLLLAGVRQERIKPASRPPFPGKSSPIAVEEAPPFPAALFTQSRAQFAQQILPFIEEAFEKKDWQEVLQKTQALLQPDDAHTLSSAIYRFHGLALLNVGEVERASEALEIALALENNEEKRLSVLQDYTAVLAKLGRWSEVFSQAETILQERPEAIHGQLMQQEALSRTLIRTQSQPLIFAPDGLEVFFSYSHQDLALRNELEKYLSNLKRQRAIVGWHDGEIGAGGEWDREIEEHLNRAHIILLLISQDFIASDYCYEKEMKRALVRHESGEARVLPIILRPAHWQETPFGKLQVLPREGRPVTLWADRDEAFLDVARGIQKVVERLAGPQKERETSQLILKEDLQ